MAAQPNPEQKHLRLVDCAGCEALQAQVEAMATDMIEMDRDLKKTRRERSRFENEVKRLLGQDPNIEEARELFRWWLKQSGRTERCQFDKTRQQALLAGLKMARSMFGKELEKRAVACAIVGGTKLAPVNPSTGKKHDSLPLIFRDADHFEMNIDRYRKWCREQGKEPLL